MLLESLGFTDEHACYHLPTVFSDGVWISKGTLALSSAELRESHGMPQVSENRTPGRFIMQVWMLELAWWRRGLKIFIDIRQLASPYRKPCVPRVPDI